VALRRARSVSDRPAGGSRSASRPRVGFGTKGFPSGVPAAVWLERGVQDHPLWGLLDVSVLSVDDAIAVVRVHIETRRARPGSAVCQRPSRTARAGSSRRTLMSKSNCLLTFTTLFRRENLTGL
jgi:hypothetical protein